MYSVTRLLDVDEPDRARVLGSLRTAAAASGAQNWVVEPTLPGSRNGGDVLVHLRFDSAPNYFNLDLDDPAITRVNGADYTGMPIRTGEPGSVYRALLLSVTPDTDMAAVDHHEGTITLIANAVNWNGTDERVDWAYDDAVARLDVMTKALGEPLPSSIATFERPQPQPRQQRTVEEYTAIVEKLVGDIEAGEAFQVVPSQRFEMTTQADPIDVYRVLRVTNPSPYMYLLNVPNAEGGLDFSVVGSSPEALVTVTDGVATTHPIAGTRWRGATEEDDVLLEKELLADDKERSEHLMLVDLGRNDLGRVCKPGTVRVEDYSHIERYSHVMHLVSTVTGHLADDKTALDAVTACFPAGTLSGAPKVRAMELIEEVELTRRGLYGGVLGYLDFAGNADFAIAIRTALMRGGTAYVQAGGGVVADSNGPYEYNESANKAKAVLAAIAYHQPVSRAVLRNGDTIDLGGARLQFWLSDTTQRGLRFREWLTWAGIAAVTLAQVALIYWLIYAP